jgi:hypothetical protein
MRKKPPRSFLNFERAEKDWLDYLVALIAGDESGSNMSSGRSLRLGFLTPAAARGASLFKMMDVSRQYVEAALAARCLPFGKVNSCGGCIECAN